jgi:hypothetical protein
VASVKADSDRLPQRVSRSTKSVLGVLADQPRTVSSPCRNLRR